MLLLVSVRPYRDDHWEALEFRFGLEPQTSRTSALGQDQSSECFGRMTGLSALPPSVESAAKVRFERWSQLIDATL